MGGCGDTFTVLLSRPATVGHRQSEPVQMNCGFVCRNLDFEPESGLGSFEATSAFSYISTKLFDVNMLDVNNFVSLFLDFSFQVTPHSWGSGSCQQIFVCLLLSASLFVCLAKTYENPANPSSWWCVGRSEGSRLTVGWAAAYCLLAHSGPNSTPA